MVWVCLEGCGNAQGMTRDEILKYFMKYWNVVGIVCPPYVPGNTVANTVGITHFKICWEDGPHVNCSYQKLQEEHKEIFGGEG